MVLCIRMSCILCLPLCLCTQKKNATESASTLIPACKPKFINCIQDSKSFANFVFTHSMHCNITHIDTLHTLVSKNPCIRIRQYSLIKESSNNLKVSNIAFNTSRRWLQVMSSIYACIPLPKTSRN